MKVPLIRPHWGHLLPREKASVSGNDKASPWGEAGSRRLTDEGEWKAVGQRGDEAELAPLSHKN